MKKIALFMLAGIVLAACTPSEKPAETPAEAKSSTVEFPYAATYSSNWTLNVSDQDLLMVLNSYKHWETGDMTALRATLADSIAFESWDGTTFNGLADALVGEWSASRDSLSSVKISMNAWLSSHSTDTNADFVSVWYTEEATSKDGTVSSANHHDVNMVVNGKIAWYSQYKRPINK
jgi:ketosteroid isomerase-like protein